MVLKTSPNSESLLILGNKEGWNRGTPTLLMKWSISNTTLLEEPGVNPTDETVVPSVGWNRLVTYKCPVRWIRSTPIPPLLDKTGDRSTPYPCWMKHGYPLPQLDKSSRYQLACSTVCMKAELLETFFHYPCNFSSIILPIITNDSEHLKRESDLYFISSSK